MLYVPMPETANATTHAQRQKDDATGSTLEVVQGWIALYYRHRQLRMLASYPIFETGFMEFLSYGNFPGHMLMFAWVWLHHLLKFWWHGNETRSTTDPS